VLASLIIFGLLEQRASHFKVGWLYKYITNIKKTCDVVDDTRIGAWWHTPRIHSADHGAQIDLLFEEEETIMLCDIKNTNKVFVIDKDDAAQRIRRKETFKKTTVLHSPFRWRYEKNRYCRGSFSIKRRGLMPH
jgi:hypothetical protein